MYYTANSPYFVGFQENTPVLVHLLLSLIHMFPANQPISVKIGYFRSQLELAKPIGHRVALPIAQSTALVLLLNSCIPLIRYTKWVKIALFPSPKDLEIATSAAIPLYLQSGRTISCVNSVCNLCKGRILRLLSLLSRRKLDTKPWLGRSSYG